MQPAVRSVSDSIRSSALLRAGLVGFLVLVLQVPIFMVGGLIREREATRAQAMADVTSKWGGEQTLAGPVISVPYLHRFRERDENGTWRVHEEIREASFLPERLVVDGSAESEIRSRGIFDVPVYGLTASLSGSFRKPDFSVWGVADQDVRFEQARLVMRIGDPRALQDGATLVWNGAPVEFAPGTGAAGRPGIHAPLGDRLENETFEYDFDLSLRGSVALRFLPLGKETEVRVRSDWPDPSFQGAWLPQQRSVSAEGFQASWRIPYLGRNFAQQWKSSDQMEGILAASGFGVDFLSVVDPYRMSQRSVKYQALFLVLTFGALWLLEVLSALRVHPLQYLLVGAAMCLFYLLELALSEHLGFVSAYVVATLAVVGVVTGYCVAILGTGRRAAVISAVLATLYAYLYVLLQEEHYALLLGSLGLFGALSAVMYLTRRIDWYRVGDRESPEAGSS